MAFQSVGFSTLVLTGVFVWAPLWLSGQEPADRKEDLDPSAVSAFDEGVSALETGDLEEAIQSLARAVSLEPGYAPYVHALAAANTAAGRAQPAWLLIREAIRLDPGNPVYETDFLTAWAGFEKEGWLDVGQGRKEVQRALGEPDRQQEQDGRARLIYGFMAIDFDPNRTLDRIVDTRGLQPRHLVPYERVIWNFAPGNLVQVFHQVSQLGDFATWIPASESARSPSRSFRIERYANFRPGVTVAEFSRKLAELYVPEGGGESPWQVSDENENGFLFEGSWTTPEGSQRTHLGRVVRGQRDFYRFVLETEGELGEDEAALWRKRLQGMQLAPALQLTEEASDPEASSELRRFLAWELGRKLSASSLAAALAPDAEAAGEVVARERRRAVEFADLLEVRIPVARLPLGDRTEKLAATLDYLFQSAGRELKEAIASRHGAIAADLFEGAVKLNVLLTLYAPGQELPKRTMRSVATQLQRAGVPPETVIPLLTAIEKGADTEQVERLNRELQSAVSARLYPPELKPDSDSADR